MGKSLFALPTTAGKLLFSLLRVRRMRLGILSHFPTQFRASRWVFEATAEGDPVLERIGALSLSDLSQLDDAKTKIPEQGGTKPGESAPTSVQGIQHGFEEGDV